MEMNRCPRPSPKSGLSTPTARSRASLAKGLFAFSVAVAAAVGMPHVHAATALAADAAQAHPSRALWVDVRGTPAAASAKGAARAVQPLRFRAATLDRASLTALVAAAPLERSQAARLSPQIISLPHPDGGFQRFSIVDSPVMEPALAAKHPEIKTYAGRGIDDPAANIRMDVSPLGFHASVRSPKGSWYIDPYYHLDDSLYVSYYRRDLRDTRGVFTEAVLSEAQASVGRGLYRAADTVQVRGSGFAPGSLVAITVRKTGSDVAPRQVVHATAGKDGSVVATLVAEPYKTLGSYSVTLSDGRNTAGSTYEVVADTEPTNASAGPQLRSYRLALLTDPAYANYFGGSANVTAAKVTLVNRLTQIYEAETSIRLALIGNNDALNLDTAAQFSGANGPCGGTACFPTASVTCSSATLTRNRVVIGLLAGASNFDIGHIAVGAGGGGIASLGVVGANNKAQGCTGLPTPTGDAFAVDYVAHEMGHQFSGNHTFNGIAGSCSGGNRSAGNSVEPGSGSSIMAYAGICTASDDLQPHSDPYWSMRSFDEIVAYTSAAETNISEVQVGALTGFASANAQSFQLSLNGALSAPIVGGTNYTTAGVKAAVEALTGGTVTVSALTDTTFTLTFGGTLANVDVTNLQLVNCTGGCAGYVGEVAKGGTTTRGGSTITPTNNAAPVVTTSAPSYVIPVRTPFALTGTATDADNDVVTYMWEQTDRGAATGTSLTSNTKTNGPLFRQFSTRAPVSAAGSLQYNSPGENSTTTVSTRVFPDLPQILANNTNAETGICPTTGVTLDCFSEFLPTAAYVGVAGVNAAPATLNFRLTARDGKGGVNGATTSLVLEPTAGPFLVTSPNTAVTLTSEVPQTVTWSVANTNVAPVNTANVKISLSVDGGNTYPYTLAASTPNTGSASVTLPALASATARVKIEAIGNVFFDVSNADFTIRRLGDLDGDGVVSCVDAAIVRAAIGTRAGDPGFDPRADLNNNGAVDIRDLALVTQRITARTRCQ